MKTYIKIIIGILVVLGLLVVFSTKIAEDLNYHGVPVGLTSSGSDGTTSTNTDIILPDSNSTGFIVSHYNGSRIDNRVLFSSIYPSETAMCMSMTWIEDVPAGHKGRSIAAETFLRDINQLSAIDHEDVPLKILYEDKHKEETDKILRQNEYRQKWYHWEYNAGPSKDGNITKVGIYLNESVICGNSTWVADEMGGNLEEARAITTLNIKNIVQQYNLTELINRSDALQSLDGSRYVFGPSKNGERGMGIYFKR